MTALKLPYLILTSLYCAGIFWLSNQSEPPISPNEAFTFPNVDKVAHGILYAGLAAVLSVGIRRSNDTVKSGIQWYVPIGFAILYGLSDEVHQIYVPKRDFEWLDLLADGTGATLAQLCLYTLWRKPKEKQ